jgi:uncharacterized membrane protein YbhN (UPF0104 family)
MKNKKILCYRNKTKNKKYYTVGTKWKTKILHSWNEMKNKNIGECSIFCFSFSSDRIVFLFFILFRSIVFFCCSFCSDNVVFLFFILFRQYGILLFFILFQYYTAGTKWKTKFQTVWTKWKTKILHCRNKMNNKNKHFYTVGTKWKTKKYNTVGTKWKTKNYYAVGTKWKTVFFVFHFVSIV